MKDKNVNQNIELKYEQINKRRTKYHEPIAIIGMACRFPGGINTNDKFWRMLIANECKIGRPPVGRWEDIEESLKNSSYLEKSGFLLENIEAFDCKTFRLTPKEASKMDPQQKLLLKVCWEAFENSGYAPDSLREKKIGVYVGVTNSDYANKLIKERNEKKEYDPLDSMGTNFSFLSGRVSYFFGLQGPSVAIDTACSSSLVAVSQACDALDNGKCEMAIASGVNVMYLPETTHILSKLNILSPNCEVRTFDEKANGTVRGEGCGVVVLKRLSDAEKDHDDIQALIIGGDINQDGPSSGITAPYGPAQEKLLQTAWANSGIRNTDIGYIETHGTGTKLGDPIEVMSIANVISDSRKCPLYLGAVKSNIGHLEAAAGIAGLIKTVNVVKYGVIPANPNFSEPSQYIEWDKIPIEVPQKNIMWNPEISDTRIAGISAFGLSGTNAHIIIRNYKSDKKSFENHEENMNLVKFSANSNNNLRKQVKVFQEFLMKTEKPIEDIFFSQNISKADLPVRLCVYGKNKDEIEKSLNLALKSGRGKGVLRGEKKKKIVFMFTGQGAQYVGMCFDLYNSNKIFRKYLDQCNSIYKNITGKDLLGIIFNGIEDIDRTIYTQPALFSVEYAMAQMWKDYGVIPDVLLGHSIGEYVAACMAEVFSVEDAMRLVVGRGALMEQETDSGKMLALGIGRDGAQKIIAGYEKVAIAASNRKDQTVIAGTEADIQKIYENLKSTEIRATYLNVKKAFHSPLMECMIPKFSEIAKQIKYSIPKKIIISNISGKAIGKEISNYKYWCTHVLSEVKFGESIQNLGNPKNTLFIEIGPNSILTSFVNNILGEEVNCIATYYRNANILEQITKCAATFYVSGQKLKWNLLQGERQKTVRVPNYVFDETDGEIVELKEEDLVQDELMGFKDISEIKEYIRKKLKTEMGIEENEAEDGINLLVLGINSIMISRLLNIFSDELGIKLSVNRFIESCTVEKWAEIILEVKEKAEKDNEFLNDKKENITNSFQSFPELRYEEFELNEVQNAYWAGRRKEVYLGGVGCYATFKIDIVNLDVERFQKAVELLVQRHDMLRCIISKNGKQKIAENITSPIKVYLRKDIEDMETHLSKLQKEISNKVLPLEEPLFEMVITEMDNNIWRIYFGIDFMIADALSIYILWRDLNDLYTGKDLPQLTLTFKDYLMNQDYKQENVREYSKKYWTDRILSFPNPPQLPVKNNVKNYGKFTRRKQWIAPEEWEKFVKNVGTLGLTASSALLTLYAEILSAWGGGSKFAIMLTLFNRKNIHKEVNEIVGDFTNLALVEIQRTQRTYLENAKHIQKQMQEDLENSDFSGLKFLKELRNQRGNSLFYPVVFTSALGVEKLAKSNKNLFWDNLDGILSSTPQALIDHQVYNEHNGIVLSWDSRDDMFYSGVISDMYTAYIALVRQAIENPEFWRSVAVDLRPVEQVKIQKQVNDTKICYEDKLLHQGFNENAKKIPEKVAVIYKGRSYSYGELQCDANRITNLLMENSVKSGERIAVQMRKSYMQIAVVLGILQLGCTYIPLMYNHPLIRTREIMDEANIRVLFLDEYLEDSALLEKTQLTWKECKEETHISHKVSISPDSLGYVIYTSGSTGKPKGVCISHKAAMNTIQDVNSRFDIQKGECVLAISSLSFDLSVYDIFGLLSVGGTIVMPTEEERIDPNLWYKLVEEYNVSVWNSVPSIMALFADYMRGTQKKNKTMKKILLSGDWIPLTLPEKINQSFENAELISLGGATEAAIWSNYFLVGNVEKNWNSIPYGFPLANQAFYILDEFERQCPEWVEGKLYIAGKGLSTGYLAQKDLTEQSFKYHGEIKERLYETGDFGRYRTDGSIEFLGRKDSQVKINGYRIELGEIKAAIIRCGISSEVSVNAIGKTMEEKKIVAFIADEKKHLKEDELIKKLCTLLPIYYVPERVVFVSEMPMNVNGKIDNKKLEKFYYETLDKQNKRKDNHEVIKLVESVLGINSINIEDRFSELGVSSVDMIRLANELERVYKKRPSVQEMMQYRKIGQLIDFFGENIVESLNNGVEQIALETSPYTEGQLQIIDKMKKGIKHTKSTQLEMRQEIAIPNDLKSYVKEQGYKTRVYANVLYSVLTTVSDYMKDNIDLYFVVTVNDYIFKLKAGSYYYDICGKELFYLGTYEREYKSPVTFSLYQDIVIAYSKYGDKAATKGYIKAGCIRRIIQNFVENEDELIVDDDIELKKVLSENEGILHLADFSIVDNPITAEKRNNEIKRTIEQCEKTGFKLFLEDGKLRYKAPKGKVNKNVLGILKENKNLLIDYLEDGIGNVLRTNHFPLTPIQWAYVMGRSSNCELGNISAHYYTEFTWEGVDKDRLEVAINKIINTHDILRTVVYENGTQETLNDVPYYTINIKNFENEPEFLNYQKEQSHHVFKLGEWPMFEIQILNLCDGTQRIQFEFDCTILDGWSSELLLQDLYRAYLGKSIYKPSISIKEYILNENEWLQKYADLKQDEKYWNTKVLNLPNAPQLPLIKKYSEITSPYFERKKAILSEKKTRLLLEKAKKYGFTMSAIVCTAYMRVLSNWSLNKEFTLNLTLFNRLPMHKDVSRILGDFTSITLVPYIASEKTFKEDITNTQKYLWEAVEHRNYNGLKLLKQLPGSERGKAVMPVVFTSMLYGEREDEKENIYQSIKEEYSISQTPQVALDHQALIRNNRLYLVWDYIQELFESTIIERMFQEYTDFINVIAETDDWEQNI